MGAWLRTIRGRLLLGLLGLLLGGFGLLALLWGGQMAAAVQADDERRARSELALVAQALTADTRAYAQGRMDDAALAGILAPYEARLGGPLELLFTGMERDQSANTARHRVDIDDFAELEEAIAEGVGLAERLDAAGQSWVYLATSIKDEDPIALLRLSLPASRLDALLAERWLSLLGLTLGLGLLVALLGLLLASSITRPILALQAAVSRLTAGELSHRAPDLGRDELGDLGRSFNMMAERLQHMLDEQRAFTSNAAHELRTPLTTIQLRAETLRHSPTLDSPQTRQYLADIEAEAARLGLLMQSLALLAQLDAGRAVLGRDLVDQVRFARAFIRDFEAQAEACGVALHLALPDEAQPALTVQISVSHLSIVLRNLLENALKYTPEGGEVLWTVAAEGGGVCHRIRDTGQGIAAADLARVFERFYRADKARSRQVAGTGLGLSLVRTIVEAYGGRITLHSDGPGQGTEVRVWWPVAAEPPEESA